MDMYWFFFKRGICIWVIWHIFQEFEIFIGFEAVRRKQELILIFRLINLSLKEKRKKKDHLIPKKWSSILRDCLQIIIQPNNSIFSDTKGPPKMSWTDGLRRERSNYTCYLNKLKINSYKYVKIIYW